MKMTWYEIINKYPNQYVGLKDTETDVNGELVSAEVAYAYKFIPGIMKMQCEVACSIFWTGPIETCPALTLPAVRKATISARLTWPEIVSKYPKQPIGLINTLWIEKENPTNVKSAIVIIEDAEWGSLQSDSVRGYLDVVTTGDLWYPSAGALDLLL